MVSQEQLTFQFDETKPKTRTKIQELGVPFTAKEIMDRPIKPKRLKTKNKIKGGKYLCNLCGLPTGAVADLIRGYVYCRKCGGGLRREIEDAEMFKKAEKILLGGKRKRES